MRVPCRDTPCKRAVNGWGVSSRTVRSAPGLVWDGRDGEKVDLALIDDIQQRVGSRVSDAGEIVASLDIQDCSQFNVPYFPGLLSDANKAQSRL